MKKAFWLKILSLMMISNFSLQAQAAPLDLTLLDQAPVFEGCSKGELYWYETAHKKTRELLKKAIRHVENEDDSQSRLILSNAFQKYFKASFDSQNWQIVKANILLVAGQMHKSVYLCDNKENKRTLCRLSGAGAVTPPEKNRVLLCEKLAGVAPQVTSAVFIHEAMHQFGKDVDYLSEIYCRKFYPGNSKPVQISSDRLLKTPDAYVLFLNEVAREGRPDYSLCLI